MYKIDSGGGGVQKSYSRKLPKKIFFTYFEFYRFKDSKNNYNKYAASDYFWEYWKYSSMENEK